MPGPRQPYHFAFILLCLLVILSSGCSFVDQDLQKEHSAAELQEAERWLALGDRPKAVTWINRALVLVPHSSLPYTGSEEDPSFVGLAQILEDHNDYPDVVRYLQPALKDPKIAGEWILYGYLADAQYRLGQTEASKQTYADQLKAMNAKTTAGSGVSSLQLSSITFRLQRAQAEWGAGMHDMAVADFTLLMDGPPQQRALVENKLAYSRALANDHLGVALSEAQDAVKIARTQNDPENLGMYEDTLGWVEHQMGKDNMAVSPLEDAVSLLPRESDIHYHLGMVYKKLNRARDASIEFDQVADLSPYTAPQQQG